MGDSIVAVMLKISYHSCIHVNHEGGELPMPNKIAKKSPKKTSKLFKNLSAYVISREKSLRDLASAQGETNPSDELLPTGRPKSEKYTQLDIQILFNVLEGLLKNMNQEDVRVQLTFSKLHELKAAVLISPKQQ